ncbi:hypothetical protein ALP18_04950 [Pseudomonas amygdali pv. myricae]|nr:hypothetical protein ALP18_04950 [Pseudomonas amygdali pv. myricae]
MGDGLQIGTIVRFDSGYLCYPRHLSFLTLRVGMQFVTLRVTQRFCDVRWIGVRLRSPFRPSATYFDGAKVSKTPRSCFRPDFVGFLRPVTDPGAAATGHPWPGAACSASCLASPGSASGLSRH